MYVQKRHHVDHETVKWLILVTLAGMLVLFATRRISGDPVRSVAAKNVTVGQVEDADGQADGQIDAATLDQTTRSGPGLAPTVRHIWDILELHDAARFEQAIACWEDLLLSDRGNVWRSVGIGAAYLQMGNLNDADCALRDACEREWDNAVTHHLLGVVYLTEADVADREGKAYFAEELRELARIEFEQAIATATHVDLDEPLVLQTKFVAIGQHETIFPELLLPPRTPTVGDLLATLKLEDFAWKSRIALAQISIDEGLLATAEEHLDAAADAGAAVGDLYTVLGEAYEENGEHLQASRVFIKAMKGNNQMAVSAVRAFGSLWRSSSPLELGTTPEEHSR